VGDSVRASGRPPTALRMSQMAPKMIAPQKSTIPIIIRPTSLGVRQRGFVLDFVFQHAANLLSQFGRVLVAVYRSVMLRGGSD
jgi:hypothetical protein